MMCLPSMEHVVWTCSFDETDCTMNVDSRRAKSHLLMMHFLLTARVSRDAPLIQKQIVVAPAVLTDQTAPAVVKALDERAPMSFCGLAAKAKRALLILNTDSANTCKAVGAHMVGQIMKLVVTNMYFLHAFCLMHQIALAINSLLAMFWIVNPLYCSILLMAHASNLNTTKTQLQTVCD